MEGRILWLCIFKTLIRTIFIQKFCVFKLASDRYTVHMNRQKNNIWKTFSFTELVFSCSLSLTIQSYRIKTCYIDFIKKDYFIIYYYYLSRIRNFTWYPPIISPFHNLPLSQYMWKISLFFFCKRDNLFQFPCFLDIAA